MTASSTDHCVAAPSGSTRPRRRTTITVIVVALAALGSITAVHGGDGAVDLPDTAMGSTWS